MHRLKLLILLFSLAPLVAVAATDYTIAVYSAECNNTTTFLCESGQEVQITAEPLLGHSFAQWSDGNTDNPRTITVTSDSTFTAVYTKPVIPVYTLTVVSDTCNTTTYLTESGQEVQITAEPLLGHSFVQWSDGNTDNPRTIEVTSDSTFTAVYTKPVIPVYTLTVVSGNCDTTTYLTEGGQKVQITAEPLLGHSFVQWSDGNTDNPRMIEMTSDSTLTAIYYAPYTPEYTITVVSDSCDTVTTYLCYAGGTVQITAEPLLGHGFAQWSDGNTDNPRTVTVTSDTAFQAIYKGTTGHVVMVYTSDCSAPNTYYCVKDQVLEITAVPKTTCSYFVKWTDGNTDNPRTVTVEQDMTFTAIIAGGSRTVTVETDDPTQGDVDIEIIK